MEDKRYLTPAVDIYETDDNYVVVLNMPGSAKEDIDISVADDTLTIIGKVNQVAEDWKAVKKEFELYDYKRDITIGNRIDRENIEAKYENGVLELTLAKSEETKPRKIDVKIA